MTEAFLVGVPTPLRGSVLFIFCEYRMTDEHCVVTLGDLHTALTTIVSSLRVYSTPYYSSICWYASR